MYNKSPDVLKRTDSSRLCKHRDHFLLCRLDPREPNKQKNKYPTLWPSQRVSQVSFSTTVAPPRALFPFSTSPPSTEFFPVLACPSPSPPSPSSPAAATPFRSRHQAFLPPTSPSSLPLFPLPLGWPRAVLLSALLPALLCSPLASSFRRWNVEKGKEELRRCSKDGLKRKRVGKKRLEKALRQGRQAQMMPTYSSTRLRWRECVLV